MMQAADNVGRFAVSVAVDDVREEGPENDDIS
jgi:hypothetical protein